MIYIRTDINEIIATGHFMRCLSIAEAITKLKGTVCFLVADKNGKKLLEQRGYSYIILNSKWNCLNEEIKILVKILKENQPKAILVDSYYVTENYLLCLKKYTKVIYLDDINKFHYPCDILINYSIYANDFSYQKKYFDTKFLLGERYAPLRKEFSYPYKNLIQKTVKNIMVVTGGTDEFHFALNFIKTIIKTKWYWSEKIKFHIVCGYYNTDKKKLKYLSEKYQKIHVYSYLENFYGAIKKMDIVISAGGFTLYELCACGIPTISYSLADNQIKNVKKFEEIGIIPYSGDIRTQKYKFKNLLNQIKRLAKDFAKRKQTSKRMQQLVDGMGAERIAKYLLES